MMSRLAICSGAAALALAACGGAVQQTGSQLPIGIAPQFSRLGTPAPLMQHGMRRSWMLPAAKKIKKLLYVAGAITNTVYVYDYQAATLVGELTNSGFDQPNGECVDKKGDVWITNWQGTSVLEYPHGGANPIRTLTLNTFQTACSIDPTTGDLAVGTFYGDVDVWKHAKGKPINYGSSQCPYIWGPGYDNHGNLFMESETAYPYGIFICELAHGGTSLQIVPANWTINYGADVMWDGKYMTFADQSFNGAISAGVYQATESASGLTLAGSTALNDPCGYGYSDVVQPFIVGRKNTPKNDRQGKVIIGSNNACLKSVNYWAYPAGGNPQSIIHAPDKVTWGSVVSIKG